MSSGRDDSSSVPTIAALITAYRDRSGQPSYNDMARRVRDEIQPSAIHRLHTGRTRTFPEPRTVGLLAELLEVPVTTIVLGLAAGLGLPVKDTEPGLLRMLPPGTDKLTDDDLEVVRVILRRLIALRGQASTAAEPTSLPKLPEPTADNLVDLARLDPPDVSQLAARQGESEGRLLRSVQDDDAES